MLGKYNYPSPQGRTFSVYYFSSLLATVDLAVRIATMYLDTLVPFRLLPVNTKGCKLRGGYAAVPSTANFLIAV